MNILVNEIQHPNPLRRHLESDAVPPNSCSRSSNRLKTRRRCGRSPCNDPRYAKKRSTNSWSSCRLMAGFPRGANLVKRGCCAQVRINLRNGPSLLPQRCSMSLSLTLPVLIRLKISRRTSSATPSRNSIIRNVWRPKRRWRTNGRSRNRNPWSLVRIFSSPKTRSFDMNRARVRTRCEPSTISARPSLPSTSATKRSGMGKPINTDSMNRD